MTTAAAPKKRRPSRNTKINVPVRVHPSTRKQLEKMFDAAGCTSLTEYVRMILDAHVREMVWCPACKVTHSIRHGEREYERANQYR